MRCFQCIYKHLSASLSYGKEIISGHSKDAELDHRIDFLGQLVNCEHHLELMDLNLFQEMKNFRTMIQQKQVKIEMSDLQFIREFYIKVENLQTGTVQAENQDLIAETEIDLIYQKIKNKDHFLFSLASVKKNLKGIRKIFVLDQKIDEAADENIEFVNVPLIDFLQDQNLTKTIAIMPENSIILKETEIKNIPVSFSLTKTDIETMKFLKMKNASSNKNYDYRKIQIVNKEKLKLSLDDYSGEFPLTVYFNLNPIHSMNDFNSIVFIDKKICCSNKSNLKIKHFASWNDEGFEEIKKYIDENTK